MGGLRPKTAGMKRRKIAIKAERKRYTKTPNQLGIQKGMALVRQEAKQEAIAEAKKLKAATKKTAKPATKK